SRTIARMGLAILIRGRVGARARARASVGARLGIGTERSMDTRWLWSQLFPRRPGFVMIVGAAEERHLVEHVLLEPFEPEIDDWRDKQRDQLRKNQTAHDHQTEWAARCGVLPEAESNRYRAHERSERSHHDGTKPFHAGFVNRRAQIPAFVNSLQGKINHHDSVLFHDA